MPVPPYEKFVAAVTSAVAFISVIVVGAPQVVAAKVSVLRKLLAVMLRFAHDFIVAGVFIACITMLLFTFTQNVERNIVIINTVFAASVLQFAIYKMCSLTLLYNSLLRLPRCTPYVSLNSIAFKKPRVNSDAACTGNTALWLDGTVPQMVLVLLLNAKYLALGAFARGTAT